ncbi:MAG: gliding motility-associated C-terminal domain-containing protein, partial [Saprospiraceae bacterium]
ITPFDPSFINTGLVNQGIIAMTTSNLTGIPYNLQNGNRVIEFCFQAIGQLGDCSPLNFVNTPTFLLVEDGQGQIVSLNIANGEICIEFSPLSFTSEIIYPDCPNAASQSNVKVTVTGGQAPYEVVIRRLPGGPSFTFPPITQDGGMLVSGGLMDGPYSVCIRDQNGLGQEICDTIMIELGSQPTLGVSLDLNSPTCFGLSDGSVSAQVTLGGINIVDPAANGYTFMWTPNTVPSPNNNTQNSVPGGLYSVTVTETATGCTAIASGTLGQPAALVLQNPSITPASCNGINDGQIIQGATGGTQFPGGGYNFNWTYCSTPDCSGPGDPVQEIVGIGQPFTLANRIAGYYTAVVTDANGCSLTTQPIQIANVRQLFVNLDAVFGPSCNGLADGRLCISATELPAFPTPDYTFFLNGPATGSPANSTANAICYEQLVPGDYTIFASDNNAGCFEIAEFTVPETPVLTLNQVSLVQPSCTSVNGGNITVIGSGGTGGPAGYQYNWNGGFTGPSRNNIGPGNYTVTLTDINGCQDSLNFTLNTPPPAEITSTLVTPIACGNDGCVEVVAPSGASYTWQNLDTGATLPNNTAQVCGLSAGSYAVTVTDIDGCMDSTTLTLAPPVNPPLSVANSTLTQPSCFGYSDGQISVDIQGGNLPIASFVWSNGQMGSVLQDVVAGVYTLVVTDALGCSLTQNFTLDEPPAIITSFSGIQKALCNNSCDGQALIEAQYNTNPPSPGTFIFVWDNGFTGSNNVTLCPGWNKVITTDANLCFREDSIFIAGAPPITANLSTLPVDCNGGTTGSRASAIGGGGNGAPFTYLWSTGQTTATIGNIPAGPYSVTVSDKDDCTQVFSVTVTEPDPLVLQQDQLATINIECFGDDDGALGVSVSGGNPGPYGFLWRDDSGNIIGNTSVVTDLKAGTYNVFVTDVKGCQGEITLSLTNPPPVIGSYLPWEPLLCNGDLTRLIIESISGGSGGPYQYSLDFGPRLNADFPIDLSGGTHFITYYDGRDCSFTDTIFVFEPDPFVVIFDPNVLELELGDSLRLNPIITGSAVDMFNWSPVDGLLNPGSLTPTVYTFTNTSYTLSVQDANGCTATGSVRIEIDPNRNIFIPNVFIPNNPKGLNTHFNIYAGLGVEQVNFFQVFDRWGTLMYERRAFLPNNDVFNEGWDGRYHGKYVNPGVFVYIAEVKFLDGRTLVYRGDVTVVR